MHFSVLYQFLLFHMSLLSCSLFKNAYSHVPKNLLVGLRKVHRLISRTYMYIGGYSTGTSSSLARVIWTASSEFGTYRLCEQQRFRRACASAQSRQNLHCSLIQAVSQEEPSDRKPDPWLLWMAGHAQLKFNITECSKTQIRLTGLICERSHVLLVGKNCSRNSNCKADSVYVVWDSCCITV